jgi:hypothetical protein
MPIDRSKFKAAPMSAMKKLDGELGQRRGYSNFQKVGYHTIDAGENKFRIYPPHPDSPDGVFWYPKSSAFLSLETDLYDEKGEKTGQKEIKRRPVFTSDIHGPKELAGKDLIKMYIDYSKKKFEQLFETEDEKKTAMALFSDWKAGITPKLTWIMYADKYDAKGQKTLALLEIGNMIKKKMNELASEMDSGDSPVSVDPFTDPEDGIAIVVTKLGEKLSTEYKVELESKRSGKLNLTFVPTPLSDADLEKFIGFEPLHKRYKNSFRRRDFELQKEGLMRFDAENEFFFFEDSEWIDQVEKLQELIYSAIPEEKNDDESSSAVQQNHEEEKPKKAPNISKSIKHVQREEDSENEVDEDESEIDEVSQPEKTKAENSLNKDRLAAIRERLNKAK